MNTHLVEKIVEAVLYEGYILYPYRPSAGKNQQRWNFGGVYPESYSVAQSGTESCRMQTECLIEANSRTTIDVKVRFLQLVSRQVGEVVADCRMPIADCGHTLYGTISELHVRPVAALEIDGKLHQTWQEALEREVPIEGVKPGNLSEPKVVPFSFPANTEFESLRDKKYDSVKGLIIRNREKLEGNIELRISNCELRNDTECDPDLKQSNLHPANGDRQLVRFTVGIQNLTALDKASQESRDKALLHSFVSTHTILEVKNGEFVSLLEPPEAYSAAAKECTNLGTYPVLVGDEGVRDCMLSSPIILYDYPKIAPESSGNLFDGTEIDEILTLRIMTLTDEEKREMRGADERARQILERTESLPVEQLMKMHGAMRGVK